MWKSIILAVISGLLFTIGWPTQGFPLFLFFAFIPLLLIEKQFSDAPFGKKGLRIFLLSLLSFLIWNALSYFWLSHARPEVNATQEQIAQAWFAYSFAVIINSLLMATVFLVFHKIRKNHGGLYGYVFLPIAWISLEKLHLNWEFAWPWLNFGNGFSHYYEWIQWYSITGALGGTLWVFLVNIFLFLALNHYLEHTRHKIKWFAIGGFFLLITPIALSYSMYFNYEEKENPIEVTLIQPQLNPYVEKYTKSGGQIVNEILDLASQEVTPQTDFILTPETAFPGIESIFIDQLNTDPYVYTIENWLRAHPKAVFVSGVDASKLTESVEKPNPTAISLGRNLWLNRYNAVIQLSDGQMEHPLYFKSKLVVGVELFPYASVLEPILGSAMLDFGGSVNSLTTQEERSVFTNSKNEAKVAPLVCYESIFGEFVSDFVKNGANVLFISTNDSWWGDTDGHLQLLEYARLRAIENRRSIARSANSGISAFINQRGDIIKSLPYDAQGALTGKINLNNEMTPYSKAGDVLGRIALLLTGILLAYHLMSLFLKKNK